jgi:hypothetical protein
LESINRRAYAGLAAYRSASSRPLGLTVAQDDEMLSVASVTQDQLHRDQARPTEVRLNLKIDQALDPIGPGDDETAGQDERAGKAEFDIEHDLDGPRADCLCFFVTVGLTALAIRAAGAPLLDYSVNVATLT